MHARERVFQIWRACVHVGQPRCGPVLTVDVLVRSFNNKQSKRKNTQNKKYKGRDTCMTAAPGFSLAALYLDPEEWVLFYLPRRVLFPPRAVLGTLSYLPFKRHSICKKRVKLQKRHEVLFGVIFQDHPQKKTNFYPQKYNSGEFLPSARKR